MKFGQRDPEKALVIKLIMEELLEHSSRDKDKAMESIEEYGKGSFSNVYKVGEYVLKLGPGRREFTIPNHRRILQPIIRTIILGDKVKNKSTNDHVTVVEVQNLVEKSWFEGMEENDVEEILYHIYEELRDDRLIWLDIKPENVGKLLKKNSSNIYCDDFEIIDGTIKIRKKGREIYPHPDAIGMYGEINNPPLEKGNFVILDTDYIFTEEEYDKIKWRVGRLCKYQEDLFTKFEKRYKEQKENSTEYKR